MNSKNSVMVEINPDRILDYCDTISVMISGYLSDEQQKYIQHRSGKLIYRKRNKKYLKDYVRWVYIHQPTVESVRRLIEITQEAKIEVHLYRVDFARDYVFNTFEEAWNWGEFFKRHLVKRWHGKQTVGGYEETYYSSNRAKVALLHTIYDDLPNRFTRQPNVHLEFRITGKQALGRCGIRDLDDVLMLELFHLITPLIEKQITLRSIGERAKNWIRRKCHGLNNDYQIGAKEFKSRWFPRLMNIYQRHGIQVISDGIGRGNTFNQFLDVLELDYSTPLFQPGANQDISLMHGNLIMAGCTVYELSIT